MEYQTDTAGRQVGILDRHSRQTGWNIRQTQQADRMEYQTDKA
jgi:hypothetical protein